MAKKKEDNAVTENQAPSAERVDAGLIEKDYKPQPRDEADADGEIHDHEAIEDSNWLAGVHGAPHGSPITTNPSEFPNPYVSPEEQGMELKSTIVGPPGYGSPDPTTNAGKLLPLHQHPLREDALPEGHPAAISSDYGVQVTPSDLDVHMSQGNSDAANNDEANATDGAKELAKAEGVDLSEVEGTGENGRVQKPDVEAYLADRANQ